MIIKDELNDLLENFHLSRRESNSEDNCGTRSHKRNRKRRIDNRLLDRDVSRSFSIHSPANKMIKSARIDWF